MKPADNDEVSIFALGTAIVRNRWRIAIWMLLGAMASIAVILPRPRTYLASTSFMPQGNDADRSSLAGLAGQIGITIPTSSQALSPEFYLSLLQSRVLLVEIARDTIEVAEMGGKRLAVLDLFQVPPGPVERREEAGVRALQKIISPSHAKSTGVINVSVITEWRSASLAIAQRVLAEVNKYNERTKQGQAISERKFVEGLLGQASKELQAAEDRLAQFQRENRAYGTSPDLVLERDRLLRVVNTRQQSFMQLTQAYEEARIREVRDTPAIVVFEPPFAPTFPRARGLVIGTIIGMVLGGVIGVLLSLISTLVQRHRKSGNAEAEEFGQAINEAKAQIVGLVRRPSRSSNRMSG